MEALDRWLGRSRSSVPSLIEGLIGLFRVFRRQKILRGYVIVVILVLFAALFASLAYTPVLSPFIYALF